jgi:hypothetical protein
MAIREANGEFGVLLDANNQPPPSWHGFAAPHWTSEQEAFADLCPVPSIRLSVAVCRR